MVGIGLFLMILIPLVVVGITVYTKYLCKKKLHDIEGQDRARREYVDTELEIALHDYLQSSWESASFADSRYYTEKKDNPDEPG